MRARANWRRSSATLLLAGCAAMMWAPAAYAQAVEACCLPSGACLDTDPNQCMAMGGIPGGPGSNCGQGLCIERPCCLPDGSCQFLSPQHCQAQGGAPQPVGTTCEQAPCGQQQDCHPTPDRQRCQQTTCPNPNERCVPECVNYNPASGAVSIETCDCKNAEECRPVRGPATDSPCVVPDNGAGTATFPPEPCAYQTPDADMAIIDGLPPGTEIMIDATLAEIGILGSAPGGPLGGEVQNFKATLLAPMQGTGLLAGYNRFIPIPVQAQSATAPHGAGPIQEFDTDLMMMQGQILGDPDFDLLRITAGTAFGLPSPGHTTLVHLPGGNWAVDSFFDITYRIDFVGAPGGPLAGRSGSTTGTVRVKTGLSPPRCEGFCPPGTVCERKVTPHADGSFTICCSCRPIQQECRPNAEQTACEQVECPLPGQKCTPTLLARDPNGQIRVLACECRSPDECHIEWVPGTVPQCVGGCPLIGQECTRVVVTHDDGTQTLQCRCGGCDPSQCDDGNPCTKDICDPATGGCIHEPVNCDDGDPCTDDKCVPSTANPAGYECIHTPKNCDDGDPCTTDSCDPVTGQCLHVPLDCDDGNACTDDFCSPQFGGCVHLIRLCFDGDPCTTDQCDPKTGQCIFTPLDCDDNNVCTDDGCDPQTGECVHKANDRCQACCLPDGSCQDIPPAVCLRLQGQPQGPGTNCATVICPKPTDCIPAPDGKSCRQADCPEPNQKCNPRCVKLDPLTGEFRVVECDCRGPEQCHVELVAGAPPQCVGDCPPGMVCKQIIVTDPDGTVSFCCECEPAPKECKPNAERTACEQADCPPGEKCVPTKVTIDPTGRLIVEECGCEKEDLCHLEAIPGALPHCVGACPVPPGPPCQTIVHETPNGIHIQCRCGCDPALCDDGDPCTKDYCDPATGGCIHEPVNCDDGDPCTDDFCDPATGQCKHVPIDCDDGNVCTIDQCRPNPTLPEGFECVHTPVNCDDGNPCTEDVCDPAVGCVHIPKNCDDGDPCTDDSCDPQTGQCIHKLNEQCQACCLPDGTCQNMPPGVCLEKHGKPQGPGTDCAFVKCQEPETPKFSQPPSPEREDIPSVLSLNSAPGLTVNKVVADDFRSDGRLITSVRWWGSYLHQGYAPVQFGGAGTPFAIDGWLIGYHRPANLNPNAAKLAPLGLYFAPASKVRIVPATNLAPCDGHLVFEYLVDLKDCCLIESNPDIRVPAADPWRCPAREDGFHERRCYRYHLSIQAVVGATWGPAAGAACCVRQPTNNFAEVDVWGWHTTQVERNIMPAIQTTLSRGTAEKPFECPPLTNCPPRLPFLYGPWSLAKPVCPFPHRVNMAFELLTNNPVIPPACPKFILDHAISDKIHGPAGTFGIPLPLSGPAAVEDRAGGVSIVRLTFSEDIQADDGSLDAGDEVMVNEGTITDLSISGNVLTVLLSGVPDRSCFKLAVETGPEGITTVGSDPMEDGADNDVQVVVLQGDVNGDYIVASADITQVKARSGQNVEAGNFRWDVNADGIIASADITQVKARSGNTASCP